MPCCENAAVPKTSKLGNFFFAHASRGECVSAPESAEHIYLKTIAAKAAKSAGWSVVTEWPGEASSKEKWIADVYCEKESARIAIEVQLSYQSKEELIARQRIYASSGVRAAWLASAGRFKDDYLAQRKDVPFFRVLPFSVGEEPQVSDFGVCVSEFVVGMLSKRLSWKVTPCVYHLRYFRDACWKCSHEVKQVYGSGIDVYEEIAKTVPNMSTILSQFREFISNTELKALGINIVGCFENLKGNAPGFPYCNVCIYCGAPQNNYYVMKKLSAQSSQSELLLTEEFTSARKSSGAWHYEKSCVAP